ncbi:hypothetical protein BJY04DRAFT_206677 [Aspergillus karnatakaensis]|uniref:uncharacterized protein n=1 Tax=Aspergillus karnatakaensis TaxID=1810916 RepID=UPI003CCD2724
MATLNTKAGQIVDRAVLDSMLRRRLFYTPSFEIYGGVSGLYDYGPPGCAVLNNIVETWRKHFVLEEDMLEVDCTMLTPHEVLKTSGHVDKFADWMCKDPKTGEIFRADHLVEEVLEARLKGDKEARGEKVVVDVEKEAKKKKKAKSEAVKLDDVVVKEYEETLAQIDNFDGPQLEQIIAKYDIRNPVTGGNVLPPVAFNLMFQTSIGPSSNMPGYLRPETAQGQFLNFQKLLEFNQQAMPFASASIGKSFRNEISPRAGLLRVREFLMAEIEHFVDPEGGKKHARFDEVKDTELTLLNREVQLSGSTQTEKMTVGKAVETGLVDNETLGYFLARIQHFLLKLGVDSTKLRFRQHMANEMAHYACDCWDAELQTSYGWIECVGCADRSAYDLNVHKNKTGAPLVVREVRSEPLKIEEWQIDLDKKKFGPRFKKDGKTVEAAIDALSQELREKLSLDLQSNGKIEIDVEGVASGKVELEKDVINIEKRTRVENVREYTPNVIEPSFGIGRILYSVMEHVYWYREGDEARGVLSFPPVIAPTKVLLVPLSTNPAFRPLVQRLTTSLRRLGVSSRVDDSSASIGKRYARNDELGTPFGITVDFQSVKDNTFTLRDRDSTKQVRGGEDEILQALKSLVEGEETWEDIRKRLPEFTGQDVVLKMAPNIPSAKLTLSCPLFAADFDPRNHAFLLVAGGGGEGRSGVGNKIVLLNAYKRRELSEVVDIELSRDEDSATSLAVARSNDASIVAFVGINSSLALQKQNKNRHLRSFQIDYPPRRTDSSQEPNTDRKPGQTISLSQESLFRTVAGPKGTTDTYQRITRLSPWKDEGASRVGAITTGLASSGEIVFFNAHTTKPSEKDVIGRIRLKSGEEAEDIDIASQHEEKSLFTVAYTNGTEVFTCRISPETRSNAAPEVKCVYSPLTGANDKGPRPRFRAVRFLSPTTLLLLQNAPERKGAELVLLDLRSAASQATITRRYKLRKSIKIGLGLDVCNLGADSEGRQQSMIAVSGSDQSLEVLTLENTSRGYSRFRVYTTLRDVHPFSMTRICFSPFTPPPHPVTPETPPQYVKLASVSMGNTVVVHTFALSPTPPSSRNPRYVLVRPGESDVLTGIFGTLTSALSIALVIFLLQAFTEIRGVMPPYLGISTYLPPDIRDAIAVPYNVPPPLPSPLSPITESQLTTQGISAEPEVIGPEPQLLQDIIPESGPSLLISCNPSNNELRIEPHSPNPASKLEEEGSKTAQESYSLESDSTLHSARQWTDLSAEDRLSWKTHLINSGLWDQQEDEDESILQGIFFRELCPQPSGGDGDGDGDVHTGGIDTARE